MSDIQSINKLIDQRDVFVYRYLRHPLLLVQVNIENKDILCFYTSIQGSYKLSAPFSFPPQIWMIRNKDSIIQI